MWGGASKEADLNCAVGIVVKVLFLVEMTISRFTRVR